MSSCNNFASSNQVNELQSQLTALASQVALLEASFIAHTQQDIPEAHGYEPPETSNFDFNVVADVFDTGNNQFVLSVGVNGEFDQTTFTVEPPVIPTPNVVVDVFDTGNNQFVLSVGVGGEFDQATFTVEPPNLSNLDNHVQSNLVGSASFRNDILTINIADGESQDTFSVYLPITDSTQTIFTTEQIYMNCDELEQLINNLDNKLTNQLVAIENAVTIDISGQVDSEFACVEQTNPQDNSTSIIPNFNAIDYQGAGLLGLHNMLKLTNSNLTTIFGELCQSQNENQDVVSLVASDRFINQISGKVLVLHFVSFDNYPKRKSNSSYREVQIPAPKATFTWAEDFDSLRWYQGNQYAELRFVENYVPVSGWFKDEASANSYFNAVLTLTTATEDNRIIPKHSNPKTAIPERETRPYRAFIESVNAQGQAVCEVKYTPPNTNESA